MATSTLGSGTLVLAGTTSGTTTVTATAVAGTTTLTLPAATDTLVGKATTDTLTNKTLTGAAMNGTLGATTPSTVAATTLTTSSTVTHNGGTANGVAYLDGSKVLTTGSAMTFDGSQLSVLRSSTSTSLFDDAEIRAINTGAATLNQRIDIAMRWQDGTYNGTGGISMIRESATARSGALSLSPIDSSGNAINGMRINSTGAVALYGASTSANGVGITFPATQSASSDANTLDDYEEGTWTPTWSVSGGTIAAVNNEGFYTKVGRQVFVGGYIGYGGSVTGSPSGALSIDGLPFTASTGYGQSGGKQAGRGYAGYNFWGTTPQTTLGIAASGTTLGLSAVYTDMSRGFSNSDQVYFFATYFV